MTFEDAWEKIEHDNRFTVISEKPLSELSAELQRLFVDEPDSYILRSKVCVLSAMLSVGYCIIDKKVDVSLFQPKMDGLELGRDYEKEAWSAESDTFEECIIELSKMIDRKD